MYRVNFKSLEEDSQAVLLRTADNLDDAIGFALSLHRASNTPHLVELVQDGEFPNVVVNFKFTPDACTK